NNPPGKQLCWNGENKDLGNRDRENTCSVDQHKDDGVQWGDLRLQDMAGNVWEWTSSDCLPYGAECGNTGMKVTRGGSWKSKIDAEVSATSRRGYSPDGFNVDIGFRCVKLPK